VSNPFNSECIDFEWNGRDLVEKKEKESNWEQEGEV